MILPWESRGRAQGTCHVIPGQTLPRGLWPRPWALSDAGARVAVQIHPLEKRPWSCLAAMGKRQPRSAELLWWEQGCGPILKNAQTLPKSISEGAETFPGAGLCCSSPHSTVLAKCLRFSLHPEKSTIQPGLLATA